MEEKQIAEFTLEDGTKFLVEVDEPEGRAVERIAIDTGQMVLQARQSFEQALDKVKPVASVALAKLKDLNTPADEIEVKFGLKLNAAAGVIFAAVGGEVNFEVTLKWKKDSNS